MKMIYVLYNGEELNTFNKAPVLAASRDPEEIITLKEMYPDSILYSCESKITRKKRKRIQRIKCKSCGKDVFIIDEELPKAFPFCSERCKLADLWSWVKDEEEVEEDE